jgi:hypothetical protein
MPPPKANSVGVEELFPSQWKAKGVKSPIHETDPTKLQEYQTILASLPADVQELVKNELKALKKQDDDIFNRARLINCAFFMNAILGDYLSGILGTFREASEWCLNPLEEIRKGGRTVVNRAEGNQVTVEFNLLYRVRSYIFCLFYILTPSDSGMLR